MDIGGLLKVTSLRDGAFFTATSTLYSWFPLDTTWRLQMKIALIGATGNAGSRILAELSRRGHSVTAIARHPEKVPGLPGVAPLKADADDVKGLAAALRGLDAVLTSFHFTASAQNKLGAAVAA